MSCQTRYYTNNLYISGQIIPSTTDIELKVWIIDPDRNLGDHAAGYEAIVLFADSHDFKQGLFHYPNITVSSFGGIEGEAVIQDLGNFYDNGNINFYATIKLKNNKPYKIILHNLNAGIGWDGGVNLRIKDLEMNVCTTGEPKSPFFFSSSIQRFFDGDRYCQAGNSKYSDYESSPDLATWIDYRTVRECEERIKQEEQANAK